MKCSVYFGCFLVCKFCSKSCTLCPIAVIKNAVNLQDLLRKSVDKSMIQIQEAHMVIRLEAQHCLLRSIMEVCREKKETKLDKRKLKNNGWSNYFAKMLYVKKNHIPVVYVSLYGHDWKHLNWDLICAIRFAATIQRTYHYNAVYK